LVRLQHDVLEPEESLWHVRLVLEHVEPGSARATQAAPMVPLAHGAFSMITCCPSVWVIDSARMRPTVSVEPPGA
jgi:hypothetical protein